MKGYKLGEKTLVALKLLSKTRFQQIRSLHSKKERQQTGWTLLEGEHLVLEAVEHGVRMQAVVGLEVFWGQRPELLHRLAAAGISSWVVTAEQLKRLSTTEHPTPALAVVARPSWPPEMLWQTVGSAPFLGFIGIGIQDPGNVGTLVRTLAAAGGNGAWFSEGCADLGSPKVLRASAGMVLRWPNLEQADPIRIFERCRQSGIQTLAAVPKGGRVYTTFDWIQPTLLVLGPEGEGLRPEWIRSCNAAVNIPMPGGTESLNVSVAAGILLFEAVRQRRLASPVNK